MRKRNKRGQIQGSLGGILLVFIVIILGVVFAQAIFDGQGQMTDKQTVSDETFNLTSNGCYASGEVNESNEDCNLTVSNWYDSDDWKASESECYLSSVTVTNASGTELTEDADYTLYEDEGLVEMLNTTDTNSTNLGENVLVDYEYCGEGYIVDSGARGVTGIIGLFFVLALLFAVISMSPALRDWIGLE